MYGSEHTPPPLHTRSIMQRGVQRSNLESSNLRFRISVHELDKKIVQFFM